ncbi:MAG: YlxR family protein [Nitriliruptor sp.]|nr:MAG: YlxR family protein [Nitriliruptor sp.]
MPGTAPRAPVRTCIGCRRARVKRALLRVARTPEGVRVDPEARLPGRGAYLCPDPDCIAAARRRGASPLRRALRGSTEAEATAALDELETYVVYHQVPVGTVRSENA